MTAGQGRLVMAETDPTRKKRKLRCLADKLYQEAMRGESWAHSITSRIIGGNSRPIALAALRLITSSNFVGCSMGSLGFAP